MNQYYIVLVIFFSLVIVIIITFTNLGMVTYTETLIPNKVYRQQNPNNDQRENELDAQEIRFRADYLLQSHPLHNFPLHLFNNSPAMQPAFLSRRLERRRDDINFVLGVPTEQRENGKTSYLFETLKSLTWNLNAAEQYETLILIMIGETDQNVVQSIAAEIEATFQRYFANGLIQIIAPPVTYYANFKKLNEPWTRFRWYCKQNLDYVFLMNYAQTKGRYYLQLADNIKTEKNYITTIKDFIGYNILCGKRRAAPDWLILDFCSLGGIGKLCKTLDLLKLVHYFGMFYNKKPSAWLLEDYVSKVAQIDENKFIKEDYWRHYSSSSLFQHVGVESSLR